MQQDTEPQDFYGGIIADPMGLGKTLTMIALIASDPVCLQDRQSPNLGDNPSEPVGQTLVVVPPPRTFKQTFLKVSPANREACSLGCLGRGTRKVSTSVESITGTSSTNFTRHVVPGSFTWCRHHGKTRITTTTPYHSGAGLVLTTYHTISTEWRHDGDSVLFSRRWRRVVLDEGMGPLPIYLIKSISLPLVLILTTHTP